MNKLKIAFVIATLFLVIGLAQAAQNYNVSNYSIQSSYSGGETIKGSINMSFANQENKNISSNLGGSISLLNFLNDSGADYACDPYDCTNGYKTSNGEESKSFSLDRQQLFAFSIQDNRAVTVKNLSFNLIGDFGPSCANQIYIDLFNDGNVEFYNDKYIDFACSDKNYGCFEDEDTQITSISNQYEFCEQINLSAAPAYRIGAQIKNDSAQQLDVTAKLYDLSKGSLVGSCTLPRNNGTNFQEVDCVTNYSSDKSFEALVCVVGTKANVGRSIKTESNSPCGLSQLSSTQYIDSEGVSSQFDGDLSIYAFSLQYAAVNLNFDGNNFNKMTRLDLKNLINGYLGDKYGQNCSSNCVIPFLVGGLNQNVDIGKIILNYSAGNYQLSDNKFYSVSEIPFKINLPYKVLDLKNLGFVAPNVDGIKSLKIALDGNTLATQSVSIVAGIDFDVNPKFVAVGREIEFTASGYGNGSVTSEWDFGDGNIKTTSQNNKAVHKYQISGTYEVSVKLNSGSRVSSKTFKVFAGNAKEAANLTISEYQSNINAADLKAKTHPIWIQYLLTKSLDLTNINISLMNIKTEYGQAVSDGDYEDVLKNLSNLNVPTLLYSSDKGSNLPLVIGGQNMDLAYLAGIDKTEISAGSESKLKANIASWMSENYDAKISFETISKDVNKVAEPIVTYFKISLIRKTTNDQTYLIVGVPKSNIIFSQEYGASDAGEGSGFYIPFDGSKEIEFAVPGKVEISSLGVYISPPVYKLGVYEDIGEYEKSGFNWMRFILGIIILLVLVLVAYIFLQEWYKKNYEGLLFKNKNDLYNLINFIYNSRSAGIKDDEIRRKLSKSGWSSEQISYAFKKIDGKRTGLWEIPLFKFSENKKVKQEIMQRHPEGIDTRFINAQNL